MPKSLRRAAALVAVVCALVTSFAGCERNVGPKIASAAASGHLPTSHAAHAPFVDIASEVGLHFRYESGRAEECHFFEVLGGGVALFDLDNDGDLDVYLVQGQTRGSETTTLLSDRLYRNDLDRGTLSFHDITDEAGLLEAGYGMGVAAGDFNNDGRVDLYVTNYGPNQLLRNDGDERFANVTAAAGVDDPRWSTSAAFVDYDRDGWLDLFVCNYVNYDVALRKPCFDGNGVRDYCGPSSYDPVPDRLYRNQRDGTFKDVTTKAGISAACGPGLGVVSADVNLDGWPDLYVANDAAANQCWINQRDGTFRDEALLNGSAFNGVGSPEGGMGVDATDFDDDGDVDILVGHFAGESNTLYVNELAGGFADKTEATRLAAPSIPLTTFGIGWIDIDNDGRLDILVANGAVKRGGTTSSLAATYPQGQPNQLFRHAGDGTFASDTPATASSGDRLSRGIAFGDLDNDGAEDALVVNSHGPIELLRNVGAAGNRWIGLRLVDQSGRRDAIGAVAEIVLADGSQLQRRVYTDGSYCSASDPRIIVGLGDHATVDRLRVRWPSGRVEQWQVSGGNELRLNQYQTIRESTGNEVSQ